ncbi:molybdenum cofactor biosynthesis protein MoaE [Ningiella sp. W23]|uniref:molybdenum cofactor biosynthesis protein MoaE n=1 Tax=Ningiella sp. W23 TaxID=3023715 RepID=UPI0039F4878E
MLIDNNRSSGAVVMFVGLVRDFNPHMSSEQVTGLRLEHYPKMTESQLASIVKRARERWFLSEVRVIHRVGDLDINEQIVFVGVSSRHRESAFEAAQYIMDYLKHEATFWKKERTQTGEHWVTPDEKEQERLNRYK